MKAWLALAALLVFGVGVFLPEASFRITKNRVERELDTSLIEYQTMTPENFQKRIERIAIDNELDKSKLKIAVTRPTNSSVLVEFHYEEDVRFFFSKNHRFVTIMKGTSSLGV